MLDVCSISFLVLSSPTTSCHFNHWSLSDNRQDLKTHDPKSFDTLHINRKKFSRENCSFLWPILHSYTSLCCIMWTPTYITQIFSDSLKVGLRIIPTIAFDELPHCIIPFSTFLKNSEVTFHQRNRKGGREGIRGEEMERERGRGGRKRRRWSAVGKRKTCAGLVTATGGNPIARAFKIQN